MTDFLFTINGIDFSEYIDKNGYATKLMPVFSETITTLDGVDHKALIRKKGAITVKLNTLNETQLSTLATTVLNAPATVAYHCLERDADVSALMAPSEITARHLADCLYNGKNWHEVGDITLTEL